MKEAVSAVIAVTVIAPVLEFTTVVQFVSAVASPKVFVAEPLLAKV